MQTSTCLMRMRTARHSAMSLRHSGRINNANGDSVRVCRSDLQSGGPGLDIPGHSFKKIERMAEGQASQFATALISPTHTNHGDDYPQANSAFDNSCCR